MNEYEYKIDFSKVKTLEDVIKVIAFLAPYRTFTSEDILDQYGISHLVSKTEITYGRD